MIEIISAPPSPNRNQCTVPAGRWTRVPADAVFESEPMPKSTWPSDDEERLVPGMTVRGRPTALRAALKEDLVAFGRFARREHGDVLTDDVERRRVALGGDDERSCGHLSRSFSTFRSCAPRLLPVGPIVRSPFVPISAEKRGEGAGPTTRQAVCCAPVKTDASRYRAVAPKRLSLHRAVGPPAPRRVLRRPHHPRLARIPRPAWGSTRAIR